MFRSGIKLPISMLTSMAMMLAASGCADFHLPRIDPSGEHLFICDSQRPPVAATCPPGTVPTAPSTTTVPPAVAVCPPAAPSPITPPPAAAFPPISGPPRVTPYSDVAIQLTPLGTVQPLGSQVVMVAGVRGGDGYLHTNRRLEWSLAAGSVGQFTAIGQGSFSDFFVGDVNPPRVVSAAFAVGSTSRIPQHAGGPQSPIRTVPGQGWITISSPVEGVSRVSVVAPDVVLPAERSKTATILWIDAQYLLPTPVIAPAGSKQSLTTTVLRQSNRAPRAGWIVRYDLACGPQAVFGSAAAPSIEAVTNEAGQATAEIFQKDPSPGTSQVRVRVFRPADACSEKQLVRETSVLVTWTAPSLGIRQMGPASVALGDTITYRIEVSNPGDLPAQEIVAAEEVPESLTFVQSNPAAVVEGRRLQWRLGDLAPRQQQIIEATFRTTRQGVVTHCVDVTGGGGLRASHCANTTVLGAMPGPATTPGPATEPSPSSTPAPATIAPPGSSPTPAAVSVLDLKVTPESQATLGGNLTFAVELTNRGTVAAEQIVITDTYGDGLEYQQLNTQKRLKRTVPYLGPGQSISYGVMFRVTRLGQICHRLEAAAADGAHVATDSCVTAVSPTGGTEPPTVAPSPGTTVVTPPPSTVPPTAPSAPPSAPPSVPSTAPPVAPPSVPPLEIRVSGPTAATVGKSIVFTAQITNRGQQAIANVVVSQQSDAMLVVTQATEGAAQKGNNWTWSIPSLPPGQAVRRQVECECKQAGNACCRFAVAAENSQPITDQICVDITAATPAANPAPMNPAPINPAQVTPVSPQVLSGKLVVAVDNRNLVTAGKDQTFLVQVSNEGDSTENDIVVTSRIPFGTTANVSSGGIAGPGTYQIDQGVIRFSPVAALPPKATISYRIVLATTQPGPITLQAAATSRRQTEAATGEKTVQILAPQ